MKTDSPCSKTHLVEACMHAGFRSFHASALVHPCNHIPCFTKTLGATTYARIHSFYLSRSEEVPEQPEHHIFGSLAHPCETKMCSKWTNLKKIAHSRFKASENMSSVENQIPRADRQKILSVKQLVRRGGKFEI